MPLAQTIVLPDSRLLSFDDLGNPAGMPVLFLHGVPGSRRYWEFARADHLAYDRAVRLLAPDRPGVGRSSPAPRRCILDFAGDIEALADGLGVERFGVLAFSGGASYALAIAATLPERVAAVSLVSPVSDLSVPGLFAGLDPLTRRGLAALTAAPEGAWRASERLDSAKVLTVAASRVWSLLPSADRRALALPHVRTAAARVLEEAARHGLDGVRVDAALLAAPWGFGLSEVTCPVDIHVGTADPWSTAEMTHWFRRGLPAPRIRGYSGAGHFGVLVHHTGEALDGLVENVSRSRETAALLTKGA